MADKAFLLARTWPKIFWRKIFAEVSAAPSGAANANSETLVRMSGIRGACVMRPERIANLAATLVGRGEDQGPEHFIFGFGRIDCGNTYAGNISIEHIGAMRRGIAPAGECFGQRVVTGADIFDGDAGVELRLADALLKRRAEIVIERAARSHGSCLFVGKPHQFGIERYRAKAVIAAIAGDHRGGNAGIE